MKVPEGLLACWHPVSYSYELTEAPRNVKLLDKALVLWRDQSGRAQVLEDLCIHRGTALSLGRVEEGEIVCPYHGWRYRADGRCTLIPQLADPTKIPHKARVASFSCQERYGLIWVALGASPLPLPEISELEDDDWVVVTTGPFSWKSDASRQVENFTDFGHFPFVHPGLLGDEERTVVPDYDVRQEGHVLHYQIVRLEAANTGDFPVFANPVTARPERRSRYELHLPYTIVLRLGWGHDKGMVYFFASQPVGDKQCTGYCVIARNYNLEQPAHVLQEFEEVIFQQDQRIVESQRPEQVPFDLAEELHLKFDAVAVAYRRAMKERKMS